MIATNNEFWKKFVTHYGDLPQVYALLIDTDGARVHDNAISYEFENDETLSISMHITDIHTLLKDCPLGSYDDLLSQMLHKIFKVGGSHIKPINNDDIRRYLGLSLGTLRPVISLTQNIDLATGQLTGGLHISTSAYHAATLATYTNGDAFMKATFGENMEEILSLMYMAQNYKMPIHSDRKHDCFSDELVTVTTGIINKSFRLWAQNEDFTVIRGLSHNFDVRISSPLQGMNDLINLINVSCHIHGEPLAFTPDIIARIEDHFYAQASQFPIIYEEFLSLEGRQQRKAIIRKITRINDFNNNDSDTHNEWVRSFLIGMNHGVSHLENTPFEDLIEVVRNIRHKGSSSTCYVKAIADELITRVDKDLSKWLIEDVAVLFACGFYQKSMQPLLQKISKSLPLHQWMPLSYAVMALEPETFVPVIEHFRIFDSVNLEQGALPTFATAIVNQSPYIICPSKNSSRYNNFEELAGAMLQSFWQDYWQDKAIKVDGSLEACEFSVLILPDNKKSISTATLVDNLADEFAARLHGTAAKRDTPDIYMKYYRGIMGKHFTISKNIEEGTFGKKNFIVAAHFEANHIIKGSGKSLHDACKNLAVHLCDVLHDRLMDRPLEQRQIFANAMQGQIDAVTAFQASQSKAGRSLGQANSKCFPH